MKQFIVGRVALVFTVVAMTRAADVARPEDGLKHETRVATNSNLADTALPQLAPNLRVGPEVPMARETNPAAAPVAEGVQGAAQRRKTGAMVLAVLAVVAGSYLLQRWRSRPDPS
jgi:hypothetical protein